MAKSDWSDLIKSVRSALHEKRHFINVNDTAERNQVQKCLDIIQKSIKITSLQSMMERLEAITRQLGLKYTEGPSGKELFISSDMFYVEIQFNPENGRVKEVKISHQSDPVSCPEITDVLNNSDFTEFTKHLDGLSAIYQLNADKKQKTKAYLALHALETDLSMLAQLQSSINDPNNLVHKSPVGILEPRKGGHPMKLTFFISPYDLLDLKTKSSVPLTVDVVVKRKLGYSASVCIESSTSHKLQTVSLISVTKTAEGKSLPQFAALSNLNSSTLPACFVLRLPKQLPMSIETLRKIQAITGIETVSGDILSRSVPLVELIANSLLPPSELRDLSSYQGPYFVQLPDQCHSYYMNYTLGDLKGVQVSSIPFTHPTSVPQILIILRQQVLFNVVVCSCIRRVRQPALMESMMFEVTALSMSFVNVSFEHPTEESLATIEFDLRDITNVKCKLYDSNSFSSLCSDEYASKIMQKCFSIPVTLRAIIMKCQEKAAALREQQQKQHSRLAQQRNPKDLFFNDLSTNGDVTEHDDLPPYLSQQLLNSNQYSDLNVSMENGSFQQTQPQPQPQLSQASQQQNSQMLPQHQQLLSQHQPQPLQQQQQQFQPSQQQHQLHQQMQQQNQQQQFQHQQNLQLQFQQQNQQLHPNQPQNQNFQAQPQQQHQLQHHPQHQQQQQFQHQQPQAQQNQHFIQQQQMQSQQMQQLPQQQMQQQQQFQHQTQLQQSQQMQQQPQNHQQFMNNVQNNNNMYNNNYNNQGITRPMNMPMGSQNGPYPFQNQGQPQHPQGQMGQPMGQQMGPQMVNQMGHQQQMNKQLQQSQQQIAYQQQMPNQGNHRPPNNLPGQMQPGKGPNQQFHPQQPPQMRGMNPNQQRNMMQSQQKPNAMLLNMLSDVPAANSRKETFNMYNQGPQGGGPSQGPQGAVGASQGGNMNQQGLPPAMNQQQQPGVKPKQPRKRKGTGDIKSPGSATGRSPKRKMSEDDFMREISATPVNDFMENFGDSHLINCPTQRPPSSDAMGGSNSNASSYDVNFSSAPRSLESILTGPKTEPGTPNSGFNGSQNLNLSDFNSDYSNSYQYPNSSMSFPGTNTGQSPGPGPGPGHGPGPGPGPGPGSGSNLDLNDFSNFEYTDFANPMSLPPLKPNNKRGPKRNKSAENCNENSNSLSSLSEDGSNEQASLIKSLQDLQNLNMPDGALSTESNKQFTAPVAKSQRGLKGSNGGTNGTTADGRRCSSAGVDGPGMTGKRGNFGGSMEDGLAFKKERKRKRAESVDSISKAVVVSTSATVAGVLMPPPMITSSGEVAATGNANAYNFIDVCANGGSGQSLPPMTLGVKPVMTGINGPSLKVKKAGLLGLNNSKTKFGDRLMNKAFKGTLSKGNDGSENNGAGSFTKNSPKIGSAKSRLTKGTDSSGRLIKSGLKFKSAQNSSSPNSGLSISRNASNSSASPPVSSSSASSTPTSSGGTKSQANSAKSIIAQKRRQSSLSAVIDKLRATNPPGTEGSLSAEGLPIKSENCANRPDSSSGNLNRFNTGVSSSVNKLTESKMKYSRSSDQFTMKPISGNTLKFTVTKTKPSSTMPEFKSKKQAMSFSTKGSASSTSNLMKSTKGITPGLKRQLGGPNKAGQNFKGSTLVSSSSNLNLPKPGTSSSPKTSLFLGNRSVPGKVSSSNSANKSKVQSTEAMIDAAIPRIRIDHLPKIPRTASSQQANSNNSNSNNNSSGNSNNNNNSSGPVNPNNSNSFNSSTHNSNNFSNANINNSSNINSNNNNSATSSSHTSFNNTPSHSINSKDSSVVASSSSNNNNNVNSNLNPMFSNSLPMTGLNANSAQHPHQPHHHHPQQQHQHHPQQYPHQQSHQPPPGSFSSSSNFTSQSQPHQQPMQQFPKKSFYGTRDSLPSSSSLSSSNEKLDHSMKFQSCTISSSLSSSTSSSSQPSVTHSTSGHMNSNNGGNSNNNLLHQQHQITSNPSMSANPSLPINVVSGSNCLPATNSGVTSSIVDNIEAKVSGSCETSLINATDRLSGVSSSSDSKLTTTSTPSSPAESSTFTDALHNPPLLIPTESIDEVEKELIVNVKESTASSSTSVSETYGISTTVSTSTAAPSSSTSSTNTTSSTSSSSTLPNSSNFNVTTQSNHGEPQSSSVSLIADVYGDDDDDDEDEEGLIIDFAGPTPSSSRKDEKGVSSSTSSSSSSSSSSGNPETVTGSATEATAPNSSGTVQETSVDILSSSSSTSVKVPTPPSSSSSSSSTNNDTLVETEKVSAGSSILTSSSINGSECTTTEVTSFNGSNSTTNTNFDTNTNSNGTINTSIGNNNNSNPPPSNSSANAISESPSNQSISSLASRRSPYLIDDDLMDEALVGSAE